MGKRERKLPLPSPLERKAQGERAKKGIKDEPVKKRTGYQGGLDFAFPDYKIEPGGIIQFGRQSGKLWAVQENIEEMLRYGWDTGAMEKLKQGKKINEQPKTPTEEWLEKWEYENELAEQ